MKEFMLIFAGPPYEQLDLSPEEIQTQMQKWFNWVEVLQQKGCYLSGEALKTPAKRLSGKEPVLTDGPFVEAKELVGGYCIIKAENFDEAAELAKGFPDFHLDGLVEIREVQKF